MKLSIQLKRAGRAAELAAEVSRLESAGVDIIWVTESYGLDSPTLLGYLAARTSRVQLGFGVMNVFSRTPALIAQTAAGLDEASDGRCILGLGASGAQVIEGWHGLPYRQPVARTRAVTEIARAVWAREKRLTHEGIVDIPLPAAAGRPAGRPLKLISHPLRPRIPVYVAAMGGANVSMAAEIADGWLSYLYLPERAERAWGPALAAGAAKRAPELGPLDVVAGGMAAVGDDVRDAMDAARARTALYVGGMGPRGGNFFTRMAGRLGFAAEAAVIAELYLAGRKDEAAAAVPEELVEKTNLIGSAAFVRERIRAFRDAGVGTLDVTPAGSADPMTTIKQIREWI
jgi:F420-dependent oxidoreductase-like protein